MIRTITPGIEQIIKQTLSDKYHNIRFFKEGGTRVCFLAEWGPGNEKRIIKVDKKPESPRAIRHTQRGYTTANDIKALSQIEDPEQHHLVRLCDFEEINELGYEGTISVEPFFNSVSLEDYIKDSPLSKKEFIEIFSQIFKAEKYLIKEKGMYHRDPTAKNILIKKNGSIDTRITDLANACKIEDTNKKYLPTAGSHLFTDPRIIESFTGKKSRYDESAEIYALGTNLLLALTGSYLFEYDPDKKTAFVKKTEENLLDKYGRVDIQKHNQILDNALKELSRHTKGYKEIIKRCLTLDESLRYKDIEELIKDFEKKSRPDFLAKLKSSWRGIIAAGLLGLAGMGVFGYQVHQKNQENQRLEQLAEENDKPLIKGKWDGGNLEICNNGLFLEVTLQDKNYNQQLYPNEKAPELKQEDIINCILNLRDAPLPKGKVPSIEMKIYFEGYEELANFYLWSFEFDKATLYDGFSGDIGSKSERIIVPECLPDGNHTLIIEGYSPKEKRKEDSNSSYYGEKEIRFEKPEQVILQKRIPIVIGNPKEKIKMNQIRLDYMPHLSFSYTDKGLNVHDGIIDVETNVYAPGKIKPVYTEKSDKYTRLSLPRVEDTKERILEIIARDKQGNILSFDYFPIQAKRYEKTGIYSPYEMKLPDKNFSKEVKRLRENLYKNQAR